MNRKIILFALLFIYQYLLITAVDECSDDFEDLKDEKCREILINNNTHECIYSNNKCYASYITCSSYTVEGENKIDSKICSSISATSDDRICKVNELENKCVEDYRECKDYNGKTRCENLRAGTNQRCIFFNGKCEAHYSKCEYIEEKEKDKCGTNIPKPSEYPNKYSKCFWDTTDSSNPSCKPTDRTCSEYDTYKDFISCKDLKPKDTTDTNKKCIFDSGKGKCYEGYGDCEKYLENDRNTCQKYKYINSDNEVDHRYICDLNSDNKCKPVLKGCNDFISGEDDEEDCESFTTENNNVITKCVWEDKKCKEKYISCAAYNSIDESKRLDEKCDAIKPFTYGSNIDHHVKCVIESGVCKEKKKECSEITDENVCKGHSLEGKQFKRCVFKDKKCIEQYDSCSHYNDNEKEKNEKDCTSIVGSNCVFMNNQCIVPYTSCSSYNNDVPNDKKNEKDCTSIVESSGLRCIFTPKNGNVEAKCESKKLDCSDLKFDNLKDSCTNKYIYSNSQKCAYKNGVCSKTAKNCKEIRFITKEADKSKEGICNSAPTEGSNKICTLNKDKDGCIEQDKPESSNPNQGNDENLSGNEKHLNKILIFIVCLLL